MIRMVEGPHDENELVCSILGVPCLHFLFSTPECSSHILLQTVSDSFALQEVISCDFPLRRVFDDAVFSPSAASSARNLR